MSVQEDGSDEEINQINLVPFIDVVLVLLIMFMITAPVAYQSAVRVALPPAISGQSLDRVTLKFAIQADSKIVLEGRTVQIDQIRELVKKAKEKDPNADALVNADQSVQHGTVLQLIDALRSNGIDQVGLGVRALREK